MVNLTFETNCSTLLIMASRTSRTAACRIWLGHPIIASVRRENLGFPNFKLQDRARCAPMRRNMPGHMNLKELQRLQAYTVRLAKLALPLSSLKERLDHRKQSLVPCCLPIRHVVSGHPLVDCRTLLRRHSSSRSFSMSILIVDRIVKPLYYIL